MTGFSDLVRKSALVPSSRLDFALDEQKRTGFRLGQILVDHGIVQEPELYDAVARAADAKRLDISSIQVEREAARRIDPEWALEHRMMPVSYDEDRNALIVAVTDPTQSALLKEISARFGTSPHLLVATESELGRLIRHAYFNEPLERGPSSTPMASKSGLSKPSVKSKAPAKSDRGRDLPSFPDWPPKPENAPVDGPDARSETEPAAPKGLAYPQSKPAVQPDRAPTELSDRLRPLGPQSTLSAPEQLEPTRGPSLVVLDTPGPLGVADEAVHRSALRPLERAADSRYNTLPSESPEHPSRAPTEAMPNPIQSPSSLPGQAAGLTGLAPVVDLHQYTARAVEAIFELCVARGVITREEYLARLQQSTNRGPS
ncbi:MAG: hypothetical protein AAF449_15540 [Myxococcota bacterium]